MKQDCILTTYSTDSKGYGKCNIAGKFVGHHRLAYCEANNVPLTSIVGLEVMHNCDTPGCVNPKHLSLGTHADNMADMSRKKRNRLPDETVAAIREANGTLDDIASRFKVSRSTVSNIVNSKNGYTAQKIKGT